MSRYSFWDTNLFVYWLEQPGLWASQINQLRAWHQQRGLRVITSSLALGEMLVHPLKSNSLSMAREYKALFTEMGCLEFGTDEAWRFAELRSRYPSLKPPDAIQLSCAAVKGVEYFFTNDRELKNLDIDGIKHIEVFSAWKPEKPPAR